LGASPSRNLDHSRPFEEDMFDRSTSYRGSVGRAIGHGNSYNGKFNDKFQFSLDNVLNVKIATLAINTFRSVQTKPGSIFKHSTLPPSMRNGYYSVSSLTSKSSLNEILGGGF
jgi:actin-binding LIM protein